MVFANIKTGLQWLDKRQNESKWKRLKRAGKEKTGTPMEIQSISAVRKATPWVVFESVSSILKHTVVFGLLGAGKDHSFQCKNLDMIMFACKASFLYKLSAFWETEDTSATLSPLKWQSRTTLFKSKRSRWPLHIWHLSAIYLSKYYKNIWLIIHSCFKLLVQCFFSSL